MSERGLKMDTKMLVEAINSSSKKINESARELLALMAETGIAELEAGGVRVWIECPKSSIGNMGDYLIMEASNQYGIWHVAVELSPSATRDKKHFNGDFNCYVRRPSRNDLVKFGEAFPKLIERLEFLAK